jgi:ComF family protein
VLGLALPERCVHCSNSIEVATPLPLGRYLCAVCHRILDAETPIDEEDVLHAIRQTARDVVLSNGFALYRFDAERPIRSLIHAAKYTGMMRLASALGTQMATNWKTSFDAIVPVPLHRTRLAERGYNQSALIARGFDEKRVLERAIRRTRPTPTQTSLVVEQRIENVRNAFAMTRRATDLYGKDVLIVDDVMTTGATIASVAREVWRAQPASVSIAVVAMVKPAEPMV